VNGLLIAEKDITLGLFEPAYVGVPLAIAGFIYLLLAGRRLLPEGKSLLLHLKIRANTQSK